VWEPTLSTGNVTDAMQVAMPFVLSPASPETVEIVFVAFENSEEMSAGEQQHAGEVVAFVVEPPRRGSFMKARHRE
jgi:hypothetical protein